MLTNQPINEEALQEHWDALQKLFAQRRVNKALAEQRERDQEYF